MLTSASDNSLCVWIIEGKPRSLLQITLNVLDLPGDCNEAYLMIRDGDTAESPMLGGGKLCGWKNTPITIRPRGRNAWVEYRASSSNIGKFVLNWEQTNEDGKTPKKLFLRTI